MTTINRDRDNSGTCHTVGAGPLLTSAEVNDHIWAREGFLEISDECAATIASWWHGPTGDGAIFSRLSHRIEGGVGVRELLDAIFRAQRELDAPELAGTDVKADRLALNMLSTWALNGPEV